MRTPQLYPDAVTLVPDVAAEQLLSGIDTRAGCSVKDSFADLDLTAAGFRPLFHAEWLHRASDNTLAAPDRGWSVVTTQQQLEEWASRWGGSSEAAGFFRPALLADDAIGILARSDRGRIVAGAVANRSATVIGLSNVFDLAGDLESAWVGGAGAAAALWGRLAIVGYDSGVSLAAARRAGFTSVGELVVWLKPTSPC